MEIVFLILLGIWLWGLFSGDAAAGPSDYHR
jgi:hypothetical protein